MKDEVTKGVFKDGTEHWKVLNYGKHPNNQAIIDYAIIWSDDGEHVCDTVYGIEDALLMAKAPMMLEMIKNAIGYLEFNGVSNVDELLTDLKNTLSYDSEIV